MSERSQVDEALDEMICLNQEAGFYDPPDSESMRKLINEQSAEIARLRSALQNIADANPPRSMSGAYARGILDGQL